MRVLSHAVGTLLAMFSLGSAAAQAQSPMGIDAPAFKAGSKWVYHITSSQQSGGARTFDLQWTLAYETKNSYWGFFRTSPDPLLPYTSSTAPASAPRIVPPIAGYTKPDWNGRDNAAGSQPDVDDRNVRLDFPLSTGKTWTNEWDNTSNGTVVHCVSHHTVVGWEEIAIGTNKFHALRIESDRRSTPASAGSNAQPGWTSRTTAWYSPEVQNFVKERIEFDDGQFTAFELASFKLAD